jgi:phosphoglycerate dehydrogenase-like enzyme
MDARVAVTFAANAAQRQVFSGALGPLGGVAFAHDAPDEGTRAAVLRGAEALISWFPRRELAPADRAALAGVRLIQLLSAGADQVDFTALPAGATVAANVGAYAGPMAEHALGMAVALAKRLPRNHAKLASGTFDLAQTLRLDGGVAAILGFGGIGRACARLFRALGMRIYAVNTSGRTGEPADFIGTLGDLRHVLSAADVAVVALPLTRATRGLIGARELGWMKPEAVLVNVARGAIVDEDALFTHLKSNPDFSAGIDAWWEEPPIGAGGGQPFRPRRPFLELPNVLGSPHNSGLVPSALTAAAGAAAGNVAAFLGGSPVRGIQDPADYSG